MEIILGALLFVVAIDTVLLFLIYEVVASNPPRGATEKSLPVLKGISGYVEPAVGEIMTAAQERKLTPSEFSRASRKLNIEKIKEELRRRDAS